jgi:hypothetical protein
MHQSNQNGNNTRLMQLSFLLLTFFTSVLSHAQYKGDHIPGFTGLESGTQAPPGLYVGNLVYVYPTDTVKGNNGNNFTLPGSLTSTAEIVLVNLVTNYEVFGGKVGVSIGLPFIKNRIQFDSLDVHTNFAYTDTFAGANLGWELKRADITAGYNLYMPTGKFEPGANDNTGLGMWGNEFTIGSTVYLIRRERGMRQQPSRWSSTLTREIQISMSAIWERSKGVLAGLFTRKSAAPSRLS